MGCALDAPIGCRIYASSMLLPATNSQIKFEGLRSWHNFSFFWSCSPRDSFFWRHTELHGIRRLSPGKLRWCFFVCYYLRDFSHKEIQPRIFLMLKNSAKSLDQILGWSPKKYPSHLFENVTSTPRILAKSFGWNLWARPQAMPWRGWWRKSLRQSGRSNRPLHLRVKKQTKGQQRNSGTLKSGKS